MTVVLDSPNLERLWALLSELSAQLSANKEQCVALQRQAEELKAQAVHTNTGFALKRFNVDITQERFESELERSNAQLTVENQQLHYENRQLNALLKDYEGTLESVMGRFRGLAVRFYSSVWKDGGLLCGGMSVHDGGGGCTCSLLPHFYDLLFIA
ncbi:hypothetical protein BT69DRAFT_1354237 [Atractiella rhizophila]|nr:hypothetical protein BT69DRAFT_1354237 [Atractiella rhizophila]